MVWNLKKHRRSLPTTENCTRDIAEGNFLGGSEGKIYIALKDYPFREAIKQRLLEQNGMERIAPAEFKNAQRYPYVLTRQGELPSVGIIPLSSQLLD